MKWKKIWTRDYSVQYCEMALLCLAVKSALLLPYYIKNNIVIGEGKNDSFYFEESEEKIFVDSIVKTFMSNMKDFKIFVSMFYKTGEEYVNFAKKSNILNLAALSNLELKKIYLDYRQKLLDYTTPLSIIYYLNEYWSNYGSSILKADDKKVREALFKPIKKNTLLLMQEKAVKIKGNKAEIEKFWREYQWLPCQDLVHEPWTLKEAEDYVNNLKIVEPSESLSFEEAAEKAGLNEKEIEMFRMIKELAYIKDVRDDFRTQGVFYSRKLVEEIGRRIGLSLKEVIFLTEEEIVSFLEDKKIDINNAKTRQNKFLLYFKNGKTVCIDKNIKEELAKLGFNLEDKKSADIKGLAACKGKAKGIAKIVKTTDEISKVNKGDILISVTTHPSYITAMQKAAAIVTDEGSLLCHAAIVSRELGIPCIVGTNTATSALKDGDLVEVDADKGVVRKI